MKTSRRNTGLIICLEAEQKIHDGEATLRRDIDAAIDGMSINEMFRRAKPVEGRIRAHSH